MRAFRHPAPIRVLVVLALLATTLAGCTGPAETPSSITMSHVHGLGYDATNQVLYVATHNGLARGIPGPVGTGANAVPAPWQWSYAGTERYDYMGFTIDPVTPGTLYSSGHPSDPRAYGGTNLGLRRSTDGGETWHQRSLKGEADFHAMTSLPGAEGQLAAYWKGSVMVSRDGGLTWANQPAPPAPVLALAASDGHLWAGTTAGLYRTSDLAAWTRISAEALPGSVISLAVARDGSTLLAGMADGRGGATYRSTDGAASWQPLHEARLRSPSAPVLFAIDPADSSHAFASTADARIFESRDAGATWTPIRG